MKKNSGPLLTFPKKKKFKFPATFFKQLDEFTSGGYVLLYLNENHNPQISSHFDNSTAAMALTVFGKEYFENRSQIQSELIKNSLFPSLESSQIIEEEDEDDDEGEEQENHNV